MCLCNCLLISCHLYIHLYTMSLLCVLREQCISYYDFNFNPEYMRKGQLLTYNTSFKYRFVKGPPGQHELSDSEVMFS